MSWTPVPWQTKGSLLDRLIQEFRRWKSWRHIFTLNPRPYEGRDR